MPENMPKQAQQQSQEADTLAQQVSAPKVPGTPQTPAPEVPGTPQTTVVDESELYKKRYQSLKGMYDSQVPQYQEQIKFLQNLLGQVNPEGDQTPQTPGTSKIFGDATIEDNELEDYGSDFFDVVGRQAQIATREGLEAVNARIDQMEQLAGQLTTSQANISRSTFETDLTNVVPNWRDIDSNPEFLGWLETPDEFSGQSKFQLLRDAVSSGDAQRAATFFNTWNGGQQAQAPQQAPAQPIQVAQQTMASMATPTVAHQPEQVAAQQVAGSGRVYSKQDVAKFYSDVRKGKYNGREADVQAIENDLQLAMSEGRLTP